MFVMLCFYMPATVVLYVQYSILQYSIVQYTGCIILVLCGSVILLSWEEFQL